MSIEETPVRKGPSRRRKRPSDVMDDMSLGQRLPVIMRSKSVDCMARHEPSLLDSILCAMRRSNSFTLSDAIHSGSTTQQAKQEAEKDAKLVSERMDDDITQASSSSAWMCKGCGTSDRGNLKLNSDQSFYVCMACGAAAAESNIVENRYEKTTSHTDASSAVDVAELVSCTRNSSERKAIRESAASVTGVHKSLQSKAQTTLRKKTTTSALNSDEHLTASQNVKRDNIIVQLHALVTSAGRSPDLCVFYKTSCRLANKTFVKACMHGFVCKQRHAMCPAVLEARPAKFIACEALSRAIDTALKAVENEDMFEGLDRLAVQNASKAIQPHLQSYALNSSLKTTLNCEFDTVMSCSSISSPCVFEADFTVPESVTKANDAFVDKVLTSTSALNSMNVITEQTASNAIEVVHSFVHRGWLRSSSAMPPDIVALMVCCKLSRTEDGSDSTIETMLTNMASKFNITTEIIEAKLTDLEC